MGLGNVHAMDQMRGGPSLDPESEQQLMDIFLDEVTKDTKPKTANQSADVLPDVDAENAGNGGSKVLGGMPLRPAPRDWSKLTKHQ